MSAALVSQRIDPSFFEQQKDTTVTWLGSAGALINARGTILFIDPLITLLESEGGEKVETGHGLKVSLPVEAKAVPKADAVLYTHGDVDHFGRRTAGTLNNRLAPMYIAPPPVGSELLKVGVVQERLVTAREDASIRIGEVAVEVTPALHDWKETDPWRRGDCCGFLVKTPDGVVWHPGDTRLLDELLEVQGVDLLFFDVAEARAHLGPEGSAKLAETCGATDLIAYHYGTLEVPPGGPFGSDPEECLPLVEGLSARFHLLSPGALFRLPREQVL